METNKNNSIRNHTEENRICCHSCPIFTILFKDYLLQQLYLF